jgi:hypothetical protein
MQNTNYVISEVAASGNVVDIPKDSVTSVRRD